MRWTEKHTLVVYCALISVVCALLAAGPTSYTSAVRSTSAGNSSSSAAPRPPAAASNATAVTPSIPSPVVHTPQAPTAAPHIPPDPPRPTESASPVLVRGRELTRLLYSEQLEQLWAAFTPRVRSEWDDFSSFAAYRAEGRRAYGAEARVLKEEVVRDGGVTYYTRTATFQGDRNVPWTVIFGLTPEGRVQEFGIVGAGVLPADLTTPAR